MQAYGLTSRKAALNGKIQTEPAAGPAAKPEMHWMQHDHADGLEEQGGVLMISDKSPHELIAPRLA